MYFGRVEIERMNTVVAVLRHSIAYQSSRCGILLSVKRIVQDSLIFYLVIV